MAYILHEICYKSSQKMKPKKYLCKYFEILFSLLTFVRYFNICQFSCYSHFVVGLELLVAIPQKHTQGEAKLEA